jgi:hypothetical protein
MDNIETNTQTEEVKMTNKLIIALFMTILLAVLRIFSFEIMNLISDLMTALMIYFYMESRNKCMAIFTGINSGLGIMYSVSKLCNVGPSAIKNGSGSFALIIAIYALVVYTYIMYLAIIGYRRYSGIGMNFGPQLQDSPSTNYGNYGVITTHTQTSYTPFSGKGTTIG